VIAWDPWWIYFPIWLLLLTLFILTQSKALTRHMGMFLRIGWITCLLCTASFLILYNLWTTGKVNWNLNFIVLPVWMFAFLSGILGMLSLVSACCSQKPSHKLKYYYSGGFLLLVDLVIVPVLLLIDLKMIMKWDLNWAEVFIPLWIVDGSLLIIGVMLLIFTIGSPTGMFSLPQVCCFLLAIPGAVTFKVLLVLNLDHHVSPPLDYTVVMIPMWILLFFLGSCGLSISMRPTQQYPVESIDDDTVQATN